MKYEFRGKTLQDAMKQSTAQYSCKMGNRADCERIERLYANHVENIKAI